MRWLVIDTETGGLDPDRHPIFTVGLVVLDTQEGPICGLEVPVLDPAEPDPDALAVNGVDPDTHRATALPPSKAMRTVEQFVAPHFDPHRPITVAGHNVAFDVAFLRRLFRLAGGEPAIRISHRTVDLHSAWAVLAAAGLAPATASGSLQSIARALGIVPEQPTHSALADALTTAHCLHALVGLAGKRRFVTAAMRDWATMATSPSRPAPERLLWAGRAEGAATALHTLFGPSDETEAACTAARRAAMESVR